MKISGFTVIRNAELMGYPVVTSIRSLLPLVDELVIGIGQSEDGTKELIQSIGDPKIKTFDAFWDTEKTEGGLMLSTKSNEALEKCENDWCIYLQADEVLHEDDIPKIRQAIIDADSDKRVEGLLFKYLHFYGSYHVVATARKWYRHEIRAIRRSSGAKSFGDAQGFRINNQNEGRLNVKHTGARVFHYGWVKPPQKMGEKTRRLDHWWHGDQSHRKNEVFAFDQQYGLKKYTDSHPAIMKDLIAKQNWDFEPHRTWRDWKLKEFKYFASDVYEKVFRTTYKGNPPYTEIT